MKLAQTRKISNERLIQRLQRDPIIDFVKQYFWISGIRFTTAVLKVSMKTKPRCYSSSLFLSLLHGLNGISEKPSSSSTSSSSAIHPRRTGAAVPPLSFQSVCPVCFLVFLFWGGKNIPDDPPVGADADGGLFGERRTSAVALFPFLLLPHLLLFLMCPQQRGDSAQLGTRVH